MPYRTPGAARAPEVTVVYRIPLSMSLAVILSTACSLLALLGVIFALKVASTPPATTTYFVILHSRPVQVTWVQVTYSTGPMCLTRPEMLLPRFPRRIPLTPPFTWHRDTSLLLTLTAIDRSPDQVPSYTLAMDAGLPSRDAFADADFR